MPQAYFIFGETKYFISKIFHSFRKERISLKKALANASAFFWLGNRDFSARCRSFASLRSLPTGFATVH